MKMSSTPWHTQEISDIVHQLETNRNEGLTTDEVASRLKQYGNNNITIIFPSYKIFLRQLYSFTVIILAITAFGLLFLKQPGKSVFVMVILAANLCVKYIQQSRIERQIRPLKHQLTQQRIKVLRNHQLVEVNTLDIVPGDIIFFESGELIPADARIIEANALLVDESPLLSESLFARDRAQIDFETNATKGAMTVEKDSNTLHELYIPIGEITNMVYAGTFVVRGSGTAIVIATGNNTELGRMLQANHREFIKTDVQSQLQNLQMKFLIPISIVVGLAMAIATASILANKDINYIFELSMSFIIALVPGSIVAVASSVLAYNVYQMFQQGATVKNLADIETLGRITALCVDEISSFTYAEMEVTQIFVDGQIINREQLDALSRPSSYTSTSNDEASYIPIDLPLLMVIASLSTDTGDDIARETAMGSAINRAINLATENIGINKAEYSATLTRVAEIPYNPKRKHRNLAFQNAQGQYFTFIIGDVDYILPRCSHIQLHGHVSRIDRMRREAISMVNRSFYDTAISTLAVAYRKINAPIIEETLTSQERDLVFLGIISLDAIISEPIKESIKNSRSVGLKTVMMTDNNKENAFEIAYKLGLVEERNRVISGTEFGLLGEEEYAQQVESLLVYCSPNSEYKTRIVKHLQQHGHVVAMMGSKIDDVQPLKAADIGIGVKLHASDVALNAAKLTLMDGSFHIITDLITYAREAYYGIRNTTRWLLSCMVGQAAVILISWIIQLLSNGNFEIPLTLYQIIWINLLVNVLPLLALSEDTIIHSIIYTRPHTPGVLFKDTSRVRSHTIWDIGLRSMVTALVTILCFIVVYFGAPILSGTPETARTAACTVLLLTQLAFCFRCHCRPYETLIQRILANRSLTAIIFVSIGAHLIAMYTPFNQALGMAPMGGGEWFCVVFFSIIAILLPLNIAARPRY